MEINNQKYYTNERNVQILISLLKEHGIKKVIASPGTTNITFVGSIQQDPWFEVYSSVDERSAAYIACGMAAESGEPVVLSCTGATASRNYMSGLTEAYYRKLPILAVTSHHGTHDIGHLIAQQIDRRVIPSDIAIESVTLPTVKDRTDERFCEIEANKAILACKQRNGGPVHINMFTTFSSDFSIKNLPSANAIHRYREKDTLPELDKQKNVAIFIGSHALFSDDETLAIDKFCESNNAIVIYDHTSGYRGRYGIHWGLFLKQPVSSELKNINTLIHIGEVSGDYISMDFSVNKVWRVNEDGQLRDTFRKLTAVFQMDEQSFFEKYTKTEQTCLDYYNACMKAYNELYEKIPELPFSNIWIAHHLHNKLPEGCNLHLGILNTLRSWDFFEISKTITTNSNVGGFGIDGNVSSLIGASLVHQDKLYFGIFGDLAFFYDLNSMGNRHIGKNVRIMLINNGRGTEFRHYSHPGSMFGDNADKYIAAAGHYGHQSKSLIKHYAEDLGFEYCCASSKEEFLQAVNTFLKPEIGEKSVIFEVFTDSNDESKALEMISNIYEPPKIELIKNKVKKGIVSIVGEQGIQIGKSLLGKK